MAESLQTMTEQNNLVALGDRLRTFLNDPANAAVKNQCLKSVHRDAVGCNKKGEKCKSGAWDEDVVECEIDCGKEACLRVAGGNYIG